MRRFAFLAAALFICSSLSGCCLMGCGGYGPYGGYGGSNCAPCQPSVGMAPGYPSVGMYSPAVPSANAAAPIQQTSVALPGLPQQMVSTDQLATY